MKKRVLAILCAAALVMTMLIGCGAGSDSSKGAMMESASPMAPSVAPNYKAEVSYDSALDMEYVKGESMNGSAASGAVAETPKVEQKLIYTAYLEMESTAFDETVAALTAL